MTKKELINKSLAELSLVQEVMNRTGVSDLDDLDSSDIKQGKYPEKLHDSFFVQVMSFLHDYAEEGILPRNFYNDECISEAIEDAGDFIRMLKGANQDYSDENFLSDAMKMVKAADTRYGMDFFFSDESGIEIDQITYLGKVGERTVRNAISAGELKSYKKRCDVRDSDIVYIEKDSAYKWLLKRRGFKPTVIPAEDSINLLEVKSAVQLKSFLKSQSKAAAKHLLLEGSELQNMIDFGEMLSKKAVIEVAEVKEIAEILRINYQALLIKVYEIYFSEELTILRSKEVHFN